MYTYYSARYENLAVDSALLVNLDVYVELIFVHTISRK